MTARKNKVGPTQKHWDSYEDYLKSPEWKRIREEAIERDMSEDGTFLECQRCEGELLDDNREAHHWRYPKNWADDCADNVVMLCSLCHRAMHVNKACETREEFKKAIQEGFKKPDVAFSSGERFGAKRFVTHQRRLGKQCELSAGSDDEGPVTIRLWVDAGVSIPSILSLSFSLEEVGVWRVVKDA